MSATKNSAETSHTPVAPANGASGASPNTASVSPQVTAAPTSVVTVSRIVCEASLPSTNAGRVSGLVSERIAVPPRFSAEMAPANMMISANITICERFFVH